MINIVNVVEGKIHRWPLAAHAPKFAGNQSIDVNIIGITKGTNMCDHMI